MKRIPFRLCYAFWLALLILGMGRVIAAPLFVVTAPGVTAMPQAAPPTARFDFGIRQASALSLITQTFTLRNAGVASVTLTRIEPSCGCTTAVLSGNQTLPMRVGAGQSVSIEISLNPGHVAPGVVRKTVWVYMADDDNHPAALLEIVGTIHTDDTPAGLYIGSPAPQFTLADTTGKPFTLTAAPGHPLALFFFCGCPECAEVARQWGKAQREGRLAEATQTVVVFAGSKAAAIAFAFKNGLELSRTRLLPDPDSKVTETVYKVFTCPRVFILSANDVIRYTNDKPDLSANQAPAGSVVSHALLSLAAVQTTTIH